MSTEDFDAINLLETRMHQYDMNKDNLEWRKQLLIILSDVLRDTKAKVSPVGVANLDEPQVRFIFSAVAEKIKRELKEYHE